MAESFDAVLAEMREPEIGVRLLGWPRALAQWADRLQSARAAEIAERDRMVGEQLVIAERAKAEALRQQQERLAATVRADRAVGLLRKCRAEFAGLPRSLGYDFTHLPEIDAFLSEQAGERENGDG